MSKILNGKELAAKHKATYTAPSDATLTIFRIGDNAASDVYVRNKIKLCEELGIQSQVVAFESDLSEPTIINLARAHMADHPGAAMLQLPIPDYYDEHFMINQMIKPEEDIDCLTDVNLGKFFQGKSKIAPCTAQGIISLLKENNIEIAGKHAVIVGRSNIVGKPVAHLLLQENATITICHSKTANLKEITKQADILIVAIGKAKFISKDFVKKGAVVIDVGINRNAFGKLCGDVDFESVSEIADYITPVPGGVGPLTVDQLIYNFITLMEGSKQL